MTLHVIANATATDTRFTSAACCSPRSPLIRTATWSAVLGLVLLSACSSPSRTLRTPDVGAAMREDLPPAATTTATTGAAAAKPNTGTGTGTGMAAGSGVGTVVPTQVSDALAEPMAAPVHAAREPRIDLLVNNAPARDVFLSIVADTRYSMLMHPDVGGTLSVTLRGVTVVEALEAIRDVYGYDFKIDGRRITVYSPSLQTRIFTVNYPNSQRVGSSELRVTSGVTSGAGSSSGSTSGASGANGGSGAAGSGSGGTGATPSIENSRVSTSNKTDFWSELAGAVKGLVGNGEGRSVITSPQAGIMVVRGMPDELRQVDMFLKAAQIAVERQVMLEAKLVEVELRDGFQSGVNWGAFNATSDGGVVAGVLGSGLASVGGALTGTTISSTVAAPSLTTGGGVFGLALQTSNFAAVLGFLETQGDVQTLSSPRVATLNNQKAVLKVGTDAFYVTNVTGGSTASSSSTAGSTTTMPTVNLSPFFSGISLDVTPQIDDGTNITLHIHPAVTNVTELSKQIDLGAVGIYKLPLASSTVNETDTMVRIQDGRIVAVGGLMQMESSQNVSGLPGTTGSIFAPLFGNKTTAGRKREVIVLLKPTIIRTAEDWDAQSRKARAALDDMDEARARVIHLDGGGTK